jgi:hypothetical protein
MPPSARPRRRGAGPGPGHGVGTSTRWRNQDGSLLTTKGGIFVASWLIVSLRNRKKWNGRLDTAQTTKPDADGGVPYWQGSPPIQRRGDRRANVPCASTLEPTHHRATKALASVASPARRSRRAAQQATTCSNRAPARLDGAVRGAEEEGMNHQMVSFKSPADTPAMPECCGNPRLLCRGTRSSNPSPSSGESVANSVFAKYHSA